MFVAPDPNIKIYGPASNNYGRDIWMPKFWFKTLMRKEMIKKIFNVREEDK